MEKPIRKILLFIFLICILFGCSQNHKVADAEADIAAIKEHYDQYLLAVNTNDLDLFVSLFAEDATRMGPGAPAIVGIENIRKQIRGFFDPYNMKMVYIGETDVEVSGDQAFAYGTVTIWNTPKQGGPTTQFDINWLDALKRQADGSWKIFVDCTNWHPSLGSEFNPAEMLENQKQPSPY